MQLSCLRLCPVVSLSLVFVNSGAHAQQKQPSQGSKSRISKSVQEQIDNQLLTGMIENLSSLNEFRLSESILQEHIRNKKTDAHALLLLSSVYSSWNKFPQARRYFDEAFRFKNENTDPVFLDYQKALLLGIEDKTDESGAILKKLSSHSSLKISVKANRALAELNANPKKPIPPWLERRHISRSELNEISMQRLKTAQDNEVAEEGKPAAQEKSDSSVVAMNSNAVQLGGIAKVSSVSRWWPLNFSATTSVNLSSTYDSNILQIPDKLAPLVSDKSGIVHAGSLQAGANSPFGNGSLNITAAASTSVNANKDASNLNSINTSNNLQWTAEESSAGMSWGITNALAGSFMNTDGYKLYNWSNSTGVVFARRFGAEFGADISANGGLQKFPGVAVNNTKDERNGSTMGAALNLSGSVAGVALGGGAAWTKQDAKGTNFRTNGTTISVNASRPFQFLSSQLSINASSTRSKFPEAERARTDSQLSSSVNWGFPFKLLSERTKLSFSGSRQSSDSSLPDAAFKKYTFSAAVDHAF